MTAAKPLARYSAVEGVLASGFATADLHHAVGHDRAMDLTKARLSWVELYERAGDAGLVCRRAAFRG